MKRSIGTSAEMNGCKFRSPTGKRWASRCLPCLVLTLLVTPLALGSLRQKEGLSFEEYDELIQRYRRGEITTAVEALAPVAARSVETASNEYLSRSVSGRDVQAAVLLHTQVGVFKENEGNLSLRKAHFDAARQLLSQVGDREFKKKWRLAAGYYYQSMFEEKAALSILRSLVADYPDESEAYLAIGTVHEAIGSLKDRMQTRPSADLVMTAGERRANLERSRDRRTRLRRAEKNYRKSLELTPNYVEAHLRLGRVLSELENIDESLHHLSWAVENSSDPYLLGMAHLFSGRLHEQKERGELAISHYRAATDAMPDWQVMHLALSHALHRWGDPDESMDAMDRALRLQLTLADPKATRWWYDLKGTRFSELIWELQQGIVN